MTAQGISPSLDVRWFDGRTAGRVLSPGETVFGYVEEWLATGHSLSPLSVPFSPLLHRVRDASFDFLPGFLSDCLPDQWGSRLMLGEFQAAGIRATPIRKLAWVGRRAIGALSFHPSHGLGAEPGPWAAVQPLLLAREAQAVLRKEPPEAYANLRRGGTAGGAFPKATVALLPDGCVLCGGDVATAAKLNPSARLGILKIDCEDDPARPSTDGRLECAYMEMARAAGIRAARCEVLRESDALRPRHHLFVERFDVTSGGRVHLATLAGLLESHELTYNHLLDAVRRLTADQAEVREAVRRMAFNVRSANADDHGKNHSLMLDASLQWKLSPAYDLTLNYTSERTFGGLFPATFGMHPRRFRLAEVAAEFGVNASEFAQIDTEVAAAVDRWEDFAAGANLTKADIDRAAQHHRAIAASLAAEGGAGPKRRRPRRWT